MGLSYTDGVHCDVCHKVSDVDLSQPPGIGQRLILGRHRSWNVHIRLDAADVRTIGGRAKCRDGRSWQPKFKESLFCAGCHEQNQQALIPGQPLTLRNGQRDYPFTVLFPNGSLGPLMSPIHPANFVICQPTLSGPSLRTSRHLRMFPSRLGLREPEDNRRHLFKGPLDGETRLIDGAVYISLKPTVDNGRLHVDTSVSNFGCGHAIPTGEPMRALHLTLTVESDCGDVTISEGPSISDGGGAYAQCIVGETCSWNNGVLVWPEISEQSIEGYTVRVVRPTGDFLNYTGPGWFGEPDRLPEEKGMPEMIPVIETDVASINGEFITLNQCDHSTRRCCLSR